MGSAAADGDSLLAEEHSLDRIRRLLQRHDGTGSLQTTVVKNHHLSADVSVAFRRARRSVAGDGISTARASSGW